MANRRGRVTPLYPGMNDGEPGPDGDGVEKFGMDLKAVEIKRADMNRVFEATMELLDQVDDPQELFNAILEEYSRRLDQFPGASILPKAGHEMTQEQKQQLSLLILFSSQAVLLKEKAQLFSHLRSRNQEIRKSAALLGEALNDAEEVRSLLQATLENLPSGVVVLNEKGEHLFSNSEAESLLAANPGLVPELESCRHTPDGAGPPKAHGDGPMPAAEIQVTGPADHVRTIHRKLFRVPATAGREPLMILLLEDVTEERRLQEEILRNGRLTAVLDTWAALNHEINNPLAAILGRAQILLARSGGLDEKTVAGLKVIEESALRIVDLSARLKDLTAPTFKEYSRGVTMLDIPGAPKPERRKAG